MADKKAANQMLFPEYIKAHFSMSNDAWDSLSKPQQKDYTEQGLSECVMQLNAINSYGAESKDSIGEDIWKMAKVQKQVTKIQAMFRQKLAMKKLEKDVAK